MALRLLEGANELLADDLALLLRLAHALERGEEVLGSIHGDELDAGGLDEVMLDLLGLALTQQTVVHEHAGQLVADGLVHQRGGDGGVDAAGQAADHLCVADLFTDLRHLIIDDAGSVPIGTKAGAFMQEGFDELLAHRRVLDLRMPLHAVQFACRILHGGHRCAFGVRKHFEAFRGLFHGDAMAHPCVLLGGGACEQAFCVIDYGIGLAVFAQSCLVDVTAELVGHHLEAVADAKHRNAGIEHLRVDGGGAGLEYGSRATGQDDGLRVLGEHLVGRHGMRYKLRIDIRFAYAAGDELCVLGSEINYEHRAFCHWLSPLNLWVADWISSYSRGGCALAGRSAHPYTSCIRLRTAIRCVLTYACCIHMPARHTGKQYL